MDSAKIVLVGAGSYVFGPSILDQLLRQHRFNGIELVLYDVDAESVKLMEGVGKRIIREEGLKTSLFSTTDRSLALAGADFIINSVSRQMFRRFDMDCDIIDRLLPGHMVTEFGGVAGISYSLRQIEFIRELCTEIRRLCPKAWLLSVSNPLPRVCQAAHEEGVHMAGFCSVSLSAYGMVWKLLHDEDIYYPYMQATNSIQIEIAGLNHFCWVLNATDRIFGADLIPKIREKLADGGSYHGPVSEAFGRKTGYMLVPNDDHTRDFLPPAQDHYPRVTPAHGTDEERRKRSVDLKAVAEGTLPIETLLKNVSWERPSDFIAAMVRGEPQRLHSLNLINHGQIAELPKNVFVETGCTVTAEGPTPDHAELPEAILPYCRETAYVTDTIVQAARAHSRLLVHEAVQLDPTILDKNKGKAALDACLEAHRDLIGEYH